MFLKINKKKQTNYCFRIFFKKKLYFNFIENIYYFKKNKYTLSFFCYNSLFNLSKLVIILINTIMLLITLNLIINTTITYFSLETKNNLNITQYCQKTNKLQLNKNIKLLYTTVS